MPQAVQIQGDSAIFPGNACVHCLHPATQQVVLTRARRNSVRRVSVPFCDECIALRQTVTPFQVQFKRTATAISLLLAWMVGVWIYISVRSWAVEARNEGVWALLLGLLGLWILFAVLYFIAGPLSNHYRSPETKAALGAVTIKEFDWETTTLEFADETYAESFERVNRARDAERTAAPPEEAA